MDRATKQAIDDATQKWMQFYKSKDWKALSGLYSPDCRVFAPSMELAMGRDACAKVWQQVNKRFGATRIVLETLEFVVDGSSCLGERSTYVMYNDAGNKIDYGKYVIVWKQIDGSWYFHYDIFNTDVPKPKSIKEQIDATSAQWEYFYKSNDFKSLSQLYTKDCKVFPPGMPVCVGRQACEEAWKGLAMSGVPKIIIRNVEVVEMGPNTAADRSNYWMYDTDDKKIDNGKYVVIWKKVDDVWQLHYDIFNSNNVVR